MFVVSLIVTPYWLVTNSICSVFILVTNKLHLKIFVLLISQMYLQILGYQIQCIICINL